MSLVKHIFNKDSLEEISLDDIGKLIDTKTEESLHLDYEQIPEDVRYDGLAKHISGFLNSSGGIVVFGVSETREKGRHIPHKVTWTTIKKETLETSLYHILDPWCENIQIFPIQNADSQDQRIFVIDVPKSKTPPHMSDHRYFVRLNFQTQPLGHDQVLSIIRQQYLQKYDLINAVYGPIYSELVSYLNQTKIRQWNTSVCDQILRERMFLLVQDWDLYEKIDSFYERVKKWNQAINVSRFRLAKIINGVAAAFFKKLPFDHPDHSAMNIVIRAESTCQIPCIDEAVLNGKDPVQFWKMDYPFDQILEARVQLEYRDPTAGQNAILTIQSKEFDRFMRRLMQEVKKDELVGHILKEFDNLQSDIDTLLVELENRM